MSTHSYYILQPTLSASSQSGKTTLSLKRQQWEMYASSKFVLGLISDQNKLTKITKASI